ncbi:hypothetical protein L218DRAFT_1009110 [Marasmius fiardii PR-910]|nr:hypothetical protein L218DRAFT_1009110 [Marasmius fiardii PR-910]
MSDQQSPRGQVSVYHTDQGNLHANSSGSPRAVQSQNKIEDVHPPYPMRVPTGEQEIPSSSPHRPSISDKGKSPIRAPAPIKLPVVSTIISNDPPPSLEEQQKMKYKSTLGVSDAETFSNTNLNKSVDWQCEQSYLSTAEVPPPQNTNDNTQKGGTTSLNEFKQLINNACTDTSRYFNSLGVRFNYELDDAHYESEKHFKLLTSYAQAISEIYPSSGNQEIPRSVLDQRAYANFTATNELVGQQLQKKQTQDRDYWTQYKDIIGNSPESKGPTYYYQLAAANQGQPVASTSRAHMAPVQSSPPEVQTSTPIRSPHVGPAATSAGHQEQVQNPKPKSPLAATVTEATEEDSIVYLGSWKAEPRPKTPKPLETMHYPSYLRVAESGPSKEWTDRVALQRLRNSETRDYGRSNIADQHIGFDEDSNPVDKDTAPREVWDRDFREYINPDMHSNQRNNRCSNSHTNRNNNGHNNNNSQQQPGGVSGGNPGDPGGNGSDSDGNDHQDRQNRDNKKPSRRPDRKKCHGMPWDNDSHSDSDSFDSNSSSSTSGSEKPSKHSS